MAPTPIKICSLETRPLGWRNVLDYITGVNVRRWARPYVWFTTPGFVRDLYTFYHRGRYGWAPRDTWNLDHYYDQVIGNSLEYFADHLHGAPGGYPHVWGTHPDGFNDTVETNVEAWEADLRRWSSAFKRVATDDYYEIHGTNYQAWHDDEIARRDARTQALREMIVWWEALWD